MSLLRTPACPQEVANQRTFLPPLQLLVTTMGEVGENQYLHPGTGKVYTVNHVDKVRAAPLLLEPLGKTSWLLRSRLHPIPPCARPIRPSAEPLHGCNRLAALRDI